MSLSATAASIESRTECALIQVQDQSRKECGHARPRADCLSCRQVLMSAVLMRAAAERRKQDAKRGVQDHSPYTWAVILMEEVGECAEAMLAASFAKDQQAAEKHLARLELELTQVAAVALAAQECLIRGEWRRRPSHLARERIDILHESIAGMTAEEKQGALRALAILTGQEVSRA